MLPLTCILEPHTTLTRMYIYHLYIIYCILPVPAAALTVTHVYHAPIFVRGGKADPIYITQHLPTPIDP